MYNFSNTQYIFKQSNGNVWNFFYDQRLGLCYSILGKRNAWLETISLQKNISQGFYVDMDQDDRFHIIFQDKHGNIYYSMLDKREINTIPILKSKLQSSYNKHMSLLKNENTMYFFYTLKNESSIILAYQEVKGKEVKTPKVIDYVGKSDLPYSVVFDGSDSVYIFYQSSDGRYMQLGYKKYIISKEQQGEFTPLTRYNGDCDLPRAIIDNKGGMHICYQRINQNQYELVYQQKVQDKNIWTNETIVQISVDSFNNSSIISASGALIIYWVRNDTIYYTSSNDGGIIWSKTEKYNFPISKQLACVRYKTNTTHESDKMTAYNLPCNFTGGYKLAFYEEPIYNIDKISSDDFKSMIFETLKSLKTSISELKESDFQIGTSILNLKKEFNDTKNELEKYFIKMELLRRNLEILDNDGFNDLKEKEKTYKGRYFKEGTLKCKAIKKKKYTRKRY